MKNPFKNIHKVVLRVESVNDKTYDVNCLGKKINVRNHIRYCITRTLWFGFGIKRYLRFPANVVTLITKEKAVSLGETVFQCNAHLFNKETANFILSAMKENPDRFVIN